MLGAHTLYKIDYLKVSLLYLFRKVWANAVFISNAVLIVFQTCFGSIYFVGNRLMGPEVYLFRWK